MLTRPVIGPYFVGTRPRVSFKTQRPHKNIRRNLTLANLDDDIPMTTNSNNNTKQVIIRERGCGDGSRGRNSPLPNRNFQGGQFTGPRMRTNRIGECDWYKICVSIISLFYMSYTLLFT